MEGHVWCMVEALLSFVEGRPSRCRYGDREILRVILWAVLHDRPMVWACRPEHWPNRWRPEVLPDPSTISRRWKRPAAGVILPGSPPHCLVPPATPAAGQRR